jgi:hypothetical protein
MIYRALDIFFVIFHTLLIFFNLFGWIWKRTRKLNLIVLLLTGASWVILGFVVGTIGYCPLTDWHFSILAKMGETNLPDSYIKYLADRLTGMNFDPVIVYQTTLYTYLAALGISSIINTIDYNTDKRRKKAN